MAPASSKEFFDIQANLRVWIHTETPTWDDNNIQLLTWISKQVMKLSLTVFYKKEYS